MARTLKTFVTQSGFYDLAVAAPSMKAALEAWGLTQNVFQQGFASQTDDPDIVAATRAAPGLVLKRAVGTGEPFLEQAAPPSALPVTPAARQASAPKPARPSSPKPKKESRAAILSFEKAKAAREKEPARERKILERRRAARARAVDAAEVRLEQARKAHEQRISALQAERDKIDRRLDAEQEAWDRVREKWEAAIKAAER